MVVNTVSKAMTRVFGSRNDRLIKAYHRRVELINAREPEIRKLTDPELRAKTAEFQQRLQDGERVGQMLPEIMAVAREAMDRAVGIRNILNPEHDFDPARLPDSARKLYDEAKAKADALEPEQVKGGEPAPGWLQVDLPVELYEAVRELYPTSKPPFRARPFDVQLIGGMVLGEGKIAEMKTGEGKTIVAPLACYVACIEGLQCHVITVNDYLVQRDRDWVFPFYYRLGLTAGAIHPHHMQPPQLKKQAYECNVLYGTNSEFGFDYLRDNMKLRTEEQVQKERGFCIIDEVDSILIDEARTPLIISGPAHDDAPRYGVADNIARHLIEKQRDWNAANDKVEKVERRIKGLEGDIRNSRDKEKIAQMRDEVKKLQENDLPQLEAERDQYIQYYEVEPDKKAAHLTHDGVAEAQKVAGVGSFYVGNNMDMPHLLENALRAHAVYQRDKDYVVQGDEVVIVDEFTGRLMVGRQWSDGLHQAVEAKEGVKIKQETQTLATVTIQNFFKLYTRLAGMTGTAITEATEFDEIYDLDVVCIPTNVPVIRADRDDLIFPGQKDKWNAILDEIKRMHDIGRPVLVGTTSVENSEALSQMLQKRYHIPHEVLNAKQHEREAHVVEHAGELGAVMIATNMAGRGTDIRLAPIERDRLVRHWQQRNLLPRQATPEMSDEELIALSYRHQAMQELGIRQKEADELSDEELKTRLLRHWLVRDAWFTEEKAAKKSLEECLAILDRVPEYHRHRLEVWDHIERMGGLHIVGTERHEARRIDNQLRGRSGRQGDRGSSRFFISLEDELMQRIGGERMLSILSKVGLKEGDAIEHRFVSRAVEKAQKKVEEHNYEIRKNLLEYDEVMEHQRGAFYGIRQEVLEGRGVSQIIFDYLRDAVEDATATYLAKDYVRTQVAEWCRSQLDISVEPSKVRTGDLAELQQIVRQEARAEIRQTVEVTIGEYMSNDIPVEDWDTQGLSQWAMSRFGVDLKQNQMRQMNVGEVQEQLTKAALEQLENKDLSGLARFIDDHYGARDLAHWAKQKFGIEFSFEELGKLSQEEASEQILGRAREAYRRREITYPVQFILDLVFQAAQQDRDWAANEMVRWANQRYQMAWTPETVLGMNGQEMHDKLVEAAEQWLEGGKLEEQVREKVGQYDGELEGLAKWIEERFGEEVDETELAEADDRVAFVLEKGRRALRSELTQLERFVLLQILDMAWKDHLYGMDQLKSSISLRGYAEKDPRIEYKREGAALFEEMQRTVRDRVTELIFRAKLTPNVQLRSVYGDQQARHDTPQTTGAAGGRQAVAQQQQGTAKAEAAAVAAGAGTSEQQRDLAAAEQAGSGDGEDRQRFRSRKQRRAAQSRAQNKSGGGGGAKKRRKRSR